MSPLLIEKQQHEAMLNEPAWLTAFGSVETPIYVRESSLPQAGNLGPQTGIITITYRETGFLESSYLDRAI